MKYNTDCFIYLDFLRSFRFGKDLGLIKRKRKTPLDYDYAHDKQKCLVRLIKDILKERLKNSIAFYPPDRRFGGDTIVIQRKRHNLLEEIICSLHDYTEEEREFVEHLRNLYRLSFQTQYPLVTSEFYRIKIELYEESIHFNGLGNVRIQNSFSKLRDIIELINNYEALILQMDNYSAIYNLVHKRLSEKYNEQYKNDRSVGPEAYVTVVSASESIVPVIAELQILNLPEQNVTEQNIQTSFNLALDRWRQRQG